MNTFFRALVFIALAIFGSSSITIAAKSKCRDLNEVYYEKPGDYALKRIEIDKVSTDIKSMATLSNLRSERSTQGTRTYFLKSPNFFKTDVPWDTEVYVFGNRAKPLNLRISFHDHGNGGVTAKWLNEKLLFLSV